MKFVCDKCHTRYSISDEKVKGKVLKIRCKTCGNIIVVREQGAESADAEEPARAAAPRTEVEVSAQAAAGGSARSSASAVSPSRPVEKPIEWFVAIKGTQHGPMTHQAVGELFREGKIHDRSYCWHEGLAEWTRLRELPAFAPLLSGASAPPAGAPPPPPGEDRGAEVVSLDAHRTKRRSDEPEAPAAKASSDPFAAVGGASLPSTDTGSGPRPGEATRVFIMNAGLHNRKQKHRTYAIAAAVIVTGVVGLAYGDFQGHWKIPFLHAAISRVAESVGVETPKKRQAQAFLDDLDEEEMRYLRCKMSGADCPEPKRRRARPARTGDDSASGDLSALDLGTATGPGESGGVGRAGGGSGLEDSIAQLDEEQRERLRALLANSPGSTGPERSKPVGRPGEDTPVVSGGTGLDPEGASKVVTQNKGSLEQCIVAATKAGNTTSGKKRLILTVTPKGVVRQARVDDAVVNASPLGECLVKAGKKWKFPAYVGDETDLEVPLILQGR